MNTLLDSNSSVPLKELVKYYFNIKPALKYKEIVSVINRQHNRSLTFRTFKRICATEKLTRRNFVSPPDLQELIRNELCTSSSLVGYRQMTEIINCKYNLNVPKEAVRLALLEVDPQGVEGRRRKTITRRSYYTDGPGDVYHIDGNDKLKKWGFAIHGGIDGFSRKIIWLVVATTNNDPLVVSNLFLNCVKQYGAAPRLLRMDNGTENTYCRHLQSFFTNDENSYLNSVSIRNQRIEALWSRLKKFRTTWWIDFFTNMEKEGLYNGNVETHREVLLFYFLPVIQYELNGLIIMWNRRHVRQSSVGPAGNPDILFYLPTTVGYEHQGIPVDKDDISVASEIIGITQPPVHRNKDIFDLLECYVYLNNLAVGSSAESALDVYVKLIGLLHDDGIVF